ncbi:DUF3822 family protein [Maribacter sp.]|uniref:DUF3822 family protein n=1 Tax=Maribacter sp. TaxID=1897614 RepID=UPI0025C23755|nr:DUF3822 family protein [Maribacter sp.]
MTKRKTNNRIITGNKNFKKLSIQVSLNGLSFCVIDTINNKILQSKNVLFNNELNPYSLLQELQPILEKNKIHSQEFSEVIVIHKNSLFSLVPSPLFNSNELESYLAYNTKILENDLLAYDEIDNQEIVTVYVPFMNINNYIYDLFGEFTYKHHSTVMVHTLLNNLHSQKEETCYIHVSEQQMDITVVTNKKLKLHNCFDYNTKEDFIYYVLFTLEQLHLDPETILLKLFGSIEEEDALYNICYKYIKNITLFIPNNPYHPIEESNTESIDFTVINAL